jgi:hypothetical protein
MSDCKKRDNQCPICGYALIKLWGAPRDGKMATICTHCGTPTTLDVPPDPLRDCNYLLSLPRVCPGKAWRN